MPTTTQRLLRVHPYCCFCGGTVPAVSLDHQPARIMFPDRLRPKGLEFPACETCNAQTSPDTDNPPVRVETGWGRRASSLMMGRNTGQGTRSRAHRGRVGPSRRRGVRPPALWQVHSCTSRPRGGSRLVRYLRRHTSSGRIPRLIRVVTCREARTRHHPDPTPPAASAAAPAGPPARSRGGSSGGRGRRSRWPARLESPARPRRLALQMPRSRHVPRLLRGLPAQYFKSKE